MSANGMTMEQLQTQMQAVKNENNALKKALADSDKSQNALVEKLQLSANEVAEAQLRAEALEAELKSCHARISTLMTRMQEATLSNEEQMSAVQPQLQHFAKDLADATQQNSELLEREAMYQQQLATLKEALRTLADERQEAVDKATEAERLVAALMDALHEANERLNQHQGDLLASRRKVGQLEAEISTLVTRASAASERRSGSGRLSDSGTAGGAERQNSVDASWTVIAPPAAASATSLQACCNELAAQLSAAISAAAKLDGAQTCIAELEARLPADRGDMARATVGDWVGQLTDALSLSLEAAQAQLAELQRRSTQLQLPQPPQPPAAAVAEASPARICDWVAQLETAHARVADLELKLASSRQVPAQLEAGKQRVAELQEANRELQTRLSEALAQAHDRQQLQGANEQLRADLSEAMLQVQALNARLSASQVQVQELESVIAMLSSGVGLESWDTVKAALQLQSSARSDARSQQATLSVGSVASEPLLDAAVSGGHTATILA